MTLAEIRSNAKEVHESIHAILDSADEESRGLTAEEKTRVDELTAKRDGLLDLAEAREREQRTHIDWSAPVDKAVQPATGDKRNMEAVKGIEVGSDREAEKPFESLGEQLRSIALAVRQPYDVDKRLLHLNAQESRAPTGLGELIPADGGYLVQTDFVSGLWQRVYDQGQILSRVRRIPIGPGSNGLKWNAMDETSRADGSRWGGVRGYWVAEAGTLTASQPQFRQIATDLEKLAVLTYATEELLQDVVAMDNIIGGAAADEITFKVEDAIVRGDGSGKPLGFFNHAATITATATTAQGNNTLVRENFQAMYARMWPRSVTNAVWLVNQDTFPEIFDLLGGDSANIFLPGGNLASAPFGAILGRPIVPVEYAASLGTEGDVTFIDLSQYLLIDKGGVRGERSMHVRFLNDEMAFRWLFRVNGQPIWNSALTPYQGTNTLSPYVTLSSSRT